MPLFDVTHKPARPVLPEDSENYDVLQIVKTKRPRHWPRMIKTVDEAVDWAEAQGANGRLVWTKMAALFGYSTLQPLARVTHLRDNIVAAVGDDTACNLAIGGLLRWRISLRPDIWLVWRNESDERDPVTGKLITVSEYWIDNNFVPPQTPKKKNGLDLSGLSSAWGAAVK